MLKKKTLRTLSLLLAIFLAIPLMASAKTLEDEILPPTLLDLAGIEADEAALAEYLASVEPIVYPLTLTDAIGTEITLEKAPTAIISTSLGGDELLLGLVNDGRVLAISGAIAENADISNVADIAVNYDKAESNPEYILSLGPDLIIAPNWTSPEVLQQYRDLGINVYCVGAMLSIEEMKSCVFELGRLLGEPEKAAEMLFEIDTILGYVDLTLADLPEDGQLRALTYNSYGSTNGTGSSCDDVIINAHIKNAANEIFNEPYPQISKEMVIELDPDIILLPSVSYTDEPAEEFVEAFVNDPAFSSLKAVKNNMVLVIPDKHFTAVSQYMALAVVELARCAYPEYFVAEQ